VLSGEALLPSQCSSIFCSPRGPKEISKRRALDWGVRRQREFIEFLYACLQAPAHGLVEKSRDMGATWLACAFSIWLWLFWKGAAIGWGSRKQPLVDQLGDPDSIFEKMQMLIRNPRR
jgi:hypothetical protein